MVITRVAVAVVGMERERRETNEQINHANMYRLCLIEYVYVETLLGRREGEVNTVMVLVEDQEEEEEEEEHR